MLVLVWICSYAVFDIAPKLKINFCIHKGNVKSITDALKKWCLCAFLFDHVAMPHAISLRLKINSCIHKDNVKSIILSLSSMVLMCVCHFVYVAKHKNKMPLK